MFSNNLSIKLWIITKGCFLYVTFYPFWRGKKSLFYIGQFLILQFSVFLRNRSCTKWQTKNCSQESKIRYTCLISSTLMIITNTTPYFAPFFVDNSFMLPISDKIHGFYRVVLWHHRIFILGLYVIVTP